MAICDDRCLHGMRKGTCALCLPPRNARVPVRERAPTVHGSAAGLPDLQKYGIAVVHTARTTRARGEINIGQMDQDVEVVHIDGNPFLWAIEAILSRLPNLKTIQVIPSALDRFGGTARALCAGRGVQVIGGHIRPELAWSDDRVGNPNYEAQRRFLRGMGAEQRALFGELRALGFESAAMAARYFCLADEEYIPQRMLCEEYGYTRGSVHAVSEVILSVLFYLDATVEVGDGSKRRALVMRRHVARLRPLLASAALRQQLVADLGVSELAPGFPLARVDVFKKILVAMHTGRLAAMARDAPREHEALTLRFGLDSSAKPTYRTLLEVGTMLGGKTREWARQLEERALEWLGINEDADV